MKTKSLIFITIGFLVILVVIYFLLSSPIRWHKSKKTPMEPQNVILILVDALRADSLGCYGYSKNTSPSLDAFAQESVLFETVRSQATCTYPSANSILTSQYPIHFLLQKDQGIPQNTPYLPEILKNFGYSTAAISSSPIVRKTPSKYNPEGGFGRGFDVFKELAWQNASTVNRSVSEELKNIEQPFFLFIHYMDTHDHYNPPEPFRKRFCPPYEGKDFIKDGNPNPIEEMLYRKGSDLNLTAEDISYLKALYDSEIAYFDSEFGKFLNDLSALGYLKNTMIALCADHGESFMEHNHIKHCRSVFDIEARVPLIWKFPSGKPRGRRLALAQNLDIVPTILDYLGLDWKSFGFNGKSLIPAIEKDKEINPYVFCAQSSLISIADRSHKLILDMASGKISLYNLQTDPNEMQNLSDHEPERARRMLQLLLDWQSAQGAGLTQEDNLRLSKEIEEKLRSLGYLK
jgi:arylsulfatase A-like enzyme